jgi:osmotically-inducible protein OsmY
MKTDAQLKKDVQDELAWDPAVNATNIGVIVKDGIVTLTGHLESFAEKFAAERAVERVSGVQALAMELEVLLPNRDRRNDADIASAARNALTWNTVVPDSRIHIKVENGWITLSGEVDWDYQRRAAERALRDLLGVVGVKNLIAVTARVSAPDVQKKIVEALERQAETEAKQVQVLVNGSRVTLRGRVHSWPERQAAQIAAWSAPGVTNVVNEIALNP